MTNRVLFLTALVLALTVLVQPATADTIRLKSGRVLVGKIEDPDERGFNFRRFDNGGLLPIEWRHLRPAEVRRLQQRFGLAEAENKVTLVKAYKITIKTPAGFKSIIGFIVRRTDTTLVVRTRNLEQEIKKDLLARQKPIEQVMVPALEVYTVEEFYQAQLQEILGGVEDDPERHEKLARALAAAGAYEQARTHFAKVLELAPEYKNKGAVQRHLGQLEAALKHKDIADLMKKVDQAKARRDYVRALALAAELDAKAPGMPATLRDLWASRKEKLVKERQVYIAGRVCKRIYDLVRRVSGAKVLSREFNPDVAKEFAQKEMGDLILEKTANSLKITVEEVRELWDKREEIRGCVSVQSTSYTDGTFILSKEKAHAGTSLEGQSTKKKGGGRNAAREEMQRRIREFLRRQAAKRGGKKGGKGGEKELQSPEDWWKKARINTRKGWLMAYFAENSGLMKVKKVYADVCKTCGGGGRISFNNPASGKTEYQECPGCHGYRIRRRVQFY